MTAFLDLLDSPDPLCFSDTNDVLGKLKAGQRTTRMVRRCLVMPLVQAHNIIDTPPRMRFYDRVSALGLVAAVYVYLYLSQSSLKQSVISLVHGNHHLRCSSIAPMKKME
jgi:hypothetical protein